MAFSGIKKYIDFFKSGNIDINTICLKYGIKNYKINEDGSIDVDGDVNLHTKVLTKLPLKFNKVSGFFDCSNNSLTSLEGCPKLVGDSFRCHNNKLNSLKGCPEFVGVTFGCSFNNLTSLEGFPEDYEGRVFINENPVHQIVSLFPKEKVNKAIFWINEFDVIREGKQVVLDRLEEVFIQMSLEVPKDLKFKNYLLI